MEHWCFAPVAVGGRRGIAPPAASSEASGCLDLVSSLLLDITVQRGSLANGQLLNKFNTFQAKDPSANRDTEKGPPTTYIVAY